MKPAASLLVLSAALAACATAREPRGLRLRIDLGYGQRHSLSVLPNVNPGTGPRVGKLRSMGAMADGSCEVAIFAHESTEREQLALCGGEVTYDLQKVHEHLEWAGLVTPLGARPRNDSIGSLRVRDSEVNGVNRRQIAGVVRTRLAAQAPEESRLHELAVDLLIEPERLRGRVAGDVYALTAENDSYVGTVLLAGQASRFTITGRSALWKMPVADQVALLPLLLVCFHSARRSDTVDHSVHFSSPAVELR